MTGAFIRRYQWRRFRNRFNELSFASSLDYRLFRRLSGESGDVFGDYRFTGGIESITDAHTLWVKGEDLTIPVSLEKTKCFLLPVSEGTEPEAPEQIHWNRVCTLSEGAKVFIGGQVKKQNNRLSFCSAKDNPLMVIFYNCQDSDMPSEIIRRARTRNEYWNSLTPISIVIGALSLIYIAASLLTGTRPAFHIIVITAIISIFIPAFPILPPGLLLTVLYRRIAWNVRKIKADCDLAFYGLLPGIKNEESRKKITRKLKIRAYLLEILTWLLLLAGIIINIVFIFLLLIQLEVISFDR
jgi:hypothetical protein